MSFLSVSNARLTNLASIQLFMVVSNLGFSVANNRQLELSYVADPRDKILWLPRFVAVGTYAAGSIAPMVMALS